MAWSIVAIVLLLGTNAYQYWQNKQLSKNLVLHEEELAAVELTQGQLEKDYDLALTSLEDLKGNNSELNAIIDQQKEELQERLDEPEKHWKHNPNDWKVTFFQVPANLNQFEQQENLPGGSLTHRVIVERIELVTLVNTEDHGTCKKVASPS